MINIESKIISYREDTNDYRLCLTKEEIEEIKNAWNDGYYQGATQMEEAKQIIIDSLLKLVESTRAEVIEEYTEWLRKKHANFDEDYAEDIKSDYLEYLEQLKEQK